MELTKQIISLLKLILLIISSVYSVNIYASSPISPKLFVSITNSLDNETLVLSSSVQRGYFFSGYANTLNTIYSNNDIYFGVYSQTNNKVFTWTELNENFVLNEGFSAIKKNNQSDEIKIGNINYVLTGNEPKGLYILFLLLVNSGNNPNNIQDWIKIETTLFFIFQ